MNTVNIIYAVKSRCLVKMFIALTNQHFDVIIIIFLDT